MTQKAGRKRPNETSAEQQFLRLMSHEMRTPLTGLVNAANLLEEQSRPAELVRDRVARLQVLVEDLLDEITAGVRSSFTYAGAASTEEFRERAVIGLQSAAGYAEGRPVASSWS